MTSPLPPLNSLPTSVYPPSAYPPPSHFESFLVYPALIIPARRTGEIQKLLQELVFQEPKRKRVYALEEGLDYTIEDASAETKSEKNTITKYDPKFERKLVLTLLGPCESSKVSNDNSGFDDKVFQDPRIRSLLASAKTNSGDDSSTAPYGKSEIRSSSICLPSSQYSLLTVDEVLRRLLPSKDNNDDAKQSNDNNTNNNSTASNGNPPLEEIPSSFEVAGHIAHVNLRSESLPYKYLIGKAILDKNTKLRVVVNKIGNIENEFRTFPMEILAGEGLDLVEVERLCAEGGKDSSNGTKSGDGGIEGDEVQFKIGPQHDSLMRVELKEHGSRFQLDFEKVYWNSRLQGEHGRLVQEIVQDAENKCNHDDSDVQQQELTTPKPKKELIVADAMAGVGPFAVPLTSSHAPHYHLTPIVCHANDLNPISYQFLRTNAKLNKCFSGRLEMYNMDARAFIHKMNTEGVEVDHFIMNLPAMAPEFLDAFRGWKFGVSRPPMIHVHCFGEKAKGLEEIAQVEIQVLQRCERALGCYGCLADDTKRKKNEVNVRVVRDVGPRKNMLCVSFRLPEDVEGVEKLAIEYAEVNADVNENGKRGTDVAENIDLTKKSKLLE